MHLARTDAIVDDCYWHALSWFNWTPHHGTYRHVAWSNAHQKAMHQFTLPQKVWELSRGVTAPRGIVHINGNRKDCRAANLKMRFNKRARRVRRKTNTL